MRTITTITLNTDSEHAQNNIGEYLISKGYVFTTLKGQQVWRKGFGWLLSPMFFNFHTEGNKLHIETWMKMAILPGVFVGESGLKSGFGFVVKIPARNVLKEIISTFKQPETEVEGYNP
jgi:hypothetical protein